MLATKEAEPWLLGPVQCEGNMESFAESRAIRPILLGIASAIPGVNIAVTGADAAILAHAGKLRQDRLSCLIESLERGLDDFGGPIAIQRSDPVLHAAYVTIEAALRTSRREKIRAFARLLQAGLEAPPRLDLENEFEDYLKILDELTVRELRILFLLGRFEERNPRTIEEDDFEWTERHWSDFENAAVAQIGIPREELSGLLMRMARTGTYVPIYVAGFGGPITSTGMLTGAYKRLAGLLGNEPDLFDTGTIVP
jgi:hypothetical protein